MWTLKLTVQLQRCTNSPVVYSLVVELRLCVLRKEEEGLLTLSAVSWRGQDMVIQVTKEEPASARQSWNQLVTSKVAELAFPFNNFLWYTERN